MANLALAIIFGLMIRYSGSLGITDGAFTQMLATIVFLNIILAVFNMIPFPPLDGAKVLFAFLPIRYQYIHDYLEQNWLIFIVFVIFFAKYILLPISSFIFWLITGVGI